MLGKEHLDEIAEKALWASVEVIDKGRMEQIERTGGVPPTFGTASPKGWKTPPPPSWYRHTVPPRPWPTHHQTPGSVTLDRTTTGAQLFAEDGLTRVSVSLGRAALVDLVQSALEILRDRPRPRPVPLVEP